MVSFTESDFPAGVDQLDLLPSVCDSCGASNDTLRFSGHPSIVSTVVDMEERLAVGLFCESCRAWRAAHAIAISLAAGWWSLKGPAATVRSIVTNLSGGDQAAQANAELHRSLANQRIEAGDLDAAACSLRIAQTLRPNQETGRALWTLAKAGHKGDLRKPSLRIRFAPALPIAVFTALAAVIGASFVSNGDVKSGNSTSASMVRARSRGQVAAANAAKERFVQGERLREYQTELGRVRQLAQQHASLFRKGDRSSRAVAAEMVLIADRLQSSVSDPASADVPPTAYVEARLTAAFADLRERVIAGNEISTVQFAVDSIGETPKTAAVVSVEKRAAAYAELRKVLAKAAMHYRPGGHVDVIQRTTNEVFEGLVGAEIHRLIAITNGREVSAGFEEALRSRASSVENAVDELEVRAIVLAIAEQAFNRCLARFDR